LPPLKERKRISTHEILLGTPIQPIDRMKTISADDFEVMTLEWAMGFLEKYKKVRQIGEVFVISNEKCKWLLKCTNSHKIV